MPVTFDIPFSEDLSSLRSWSSTLTWVTAVAGALFAVLGAFKVAVVDRWKASAEARVTADRTIPTDVREIARDVLREFTGTRVELTGYGGDNEAMRFRDELASLLTDNGWQVRKSALVVSGEPPPRDIDIVHRPGEMIRESENIESMMRRIGYAVRRYPRGNLPNDTSLQVIIGEHSRRSP